MNEMVFSYGTRIQEVVNRTLADYSLKNIFGQLGPAVEYDERIPNERMMADVADIKGVFTDCVNNADNTFDDISAVFAMLCTCCAKYNLSYALSNQFNVESFLTDIADDKKHQFLLLLGKAIFSLLTPQDGISSYFRDAYKLCPDNEIINLYRFIGLAQMLHVDPCSRIPCVCHLAAYFASDYVDVSDLQTLVHNDMLSSYKILSESEQLKKYVVTRLDKNQYWTRNLPYIEYAAWEESVMEGCCYDYAQISQGASLDGTEDDGERIMKVLKAFSRELAASKRLPGRPTSRGLVSLLDRLNIVARRKGLCATNVADKANETRSDNTKEQSPVEHADSGREVSTPKLYLNKRFFLLATPCQIQPTSISTSDLWTESLRANVATRERDRAIADKATVISDFAHTYGNMKATGLYTIAQTLLKNDNIEIKRLGRQALLEYCIKQDLTKAVYMMRLRFEDKADKLRELLRDSIPETLDDTVEHIAEIVSSALQKSLLRAFYDRSDSKAKLACDQMKKVVEKLNPLRDSFEQEVVSKGMNSVRWMNERITRVKLDISDSWEQMAFRKESYATVFLSDIFAECFFNILKYADLKQEISLRFDECEQNLIVEIENTVAQMDSAYNGVGLSSKGAMLDIVNGTNLDKGIPSLTWNTKDGVFYTRILLNKLVLQRS